MTKSTDSTEFATHLPPPSQPPSPTQVADAYIESCAADLMLRAGRQSDIGPRRFYRAAANALQRVRRDYLAKWQRGAIKAAKKAAVEEPAALGAAEDQGGVQ